MRSEIPELGRKLSELEHRLLLFRKAWEEWHRGMREADKESVRAYAEKNPRPGIPRELSLYLGHWSPLTLGRLVEDGYFTGDLIVQVKGKHGDSFYILAADDGEAHGRLALKMVEERRSWYPEPTEPKRPEVHDDEAIARLPEKFREIARRDLEEYRRDMRAYQQEKADFELARKALSGDAVAAVSLVKNRYDAEYEGYEVIKPEREC